MIPLSLALFRAAHIIGFITFINASLSHVGQCTGTERDAKHSEATRIFKSWGQDFLFLQDLSLSFGADVCYATVGVFVPRDNCSTRPTVCSYVQSKERKRF